VTLAPRGLLIEEQRTNSIRNNMMVGAVSGTPGTLPTNWSVGGAGTLSQEIVGVGVENGVNYIDVRFFGTASTGSAGVRFETTTGIPAASGQTWTGSVYGRLVAGTTNNVPTIGVNVAGLTAAGAGTTDNATTNFGTSIVAANLAANRISVSRTLSDATTAFLRVQFLLGLTNGAAIDITLRIGMPQLEQGAFGTSVLPTTTAADTRAADVATMIGANFSNWYNQIEGTIYSEVIFGANVATQTGVLSAYQAAGASNNRVSIRVGNTIITSGGTQVANLFPVATANSVGKWATAYKTDSFAQSVNGNVPATDTSGAAPVSVDELEIGGVEGSTGLQLNGHIRRIAYYPRRLANTELQTITS
jgi:hypothetical protein